MQNSKLPLPLKPKTSKSFRSIVVDWRVKNRFLKNQISVLEKLKDFPIISIATFLLKSQLVEFELKQLITSLDLHLFFSNHSKVLRIKTRTPKDLDTKRLTLGKLREELNKYEGEFLNNLQIHLSDLVALRNNFVHNVFNPGSINQLNKKSEKGLKIVNKVIKNIEEVDNFIDKHDPIKT